MVDVAIIWEVVSVVVDAVQPLIIDAVDSAARTIIQTTNENSSTKIDLRNSTAQV